MVFKDVACGNFTGNDWIEKQKALVFPGLAWMKGREPVLFVVCIVFADDQANDGFVDIIA